MKLKDNKDRSSDEDVRPQDEVAEEDYDYEGGYPYRDKFSVVWRIIKRIAAVLVFAIGILFIARCCSFNNTSTLNKIIPTDSLMECGGPECEYLTHKIVNPLAPQGYFYAYSMVYAPAAHELQITVRYNVSAYDYTEVEDGHEYAFALKCGDSEIAAETLASHESGIYVYRRLAFHGVDINGETTLLMKNGDTGENYADIIVHHAEQEFSTYKLSGKERRSFDK